jgi:hypothetical protein
VLLSAFVVQLALGRVLERRQASARVRRMAAIGGTAVIACICVAAWMFSVGAIEVKLQRGIYPTFIETKHALGSEAFALGMVPTLLLGRYFKWSMLALAFAIAVFVLYWRRARPRLGSLASLAGFVLGALVPYLAGCEVFNLDRVFFPRTGGSGETKSPIEIVLAGKLPWTEREAMTEGMRELFAARAYSPEEKRLGLLSLGYPEASLEAMLAFEQHAPCNAPHPLAQPLDRTKDSNELLEDAEALSAALFDGRAEPITVWQVAMESFRADDIEGLNPNAPPELTPVMSRLYRDREHTIAFRRAYQGGLRTVHNVSSLLCGVGNFPFAMAVGRDVGHVPLRCLPDVLSDGGFEPHVYYPSDISFENMLDFFRYHGMKATQAADMPRGLPIGSWRAVTDRALYDQAVQRASPTKSELNFILTLSGHSPFSRPTDMPADAAARAEASCAKMKGGNQDDCDRLVVIAYADFALGELLDKIERSPMGRRSIVIVSADHSTNEDFVWGGAAEETARAQVPYVVYLPKALLETAPHADRIAPLLARLDKHAQDELWSLTDSPRLVTALVSASAQMRRIPPAWRFHTYGGQATSAHFALLGRPDARVWGTDASAYVFSIDGKGVVTDDEIKNATYSDVSQFDTMNPLLRGPAAFLSSFIKGYLRRCEKEVKLRMDAR